MNEGTKLNAGMKKPSDISVGRLLFVCFGKTCENEEKNSEKRAKSGLKSMEKRVILYSSKKGRKQVTYETQCDVRFDQVEKQR